MKKTMLSVLFTTALLGCTAQQTQKRETGNFSKMQISGSVEVIYTDTSFSAILVNADEKELDRVETRIEQGTLLISNKGKFSSPVKVYVSNPSLSRIECGGATTFKTTNTLNENEIAIEAAGSSSLKLEVDADRVHNQQTGASSVNIRGKARSLAANVAGASTLKGYNLQTSKAEIIASGAATAKVFVTDSVMANASGASDVKVKGNPKEFISETSSSANVNRVTESGGSPGDTTEYNWKTKKIIVISDPEKEKEKKEKRKYSPDDLKHWSGVFIGTNGLLSPAGTLRLAEQHRFMEVNYSRSFNLQLNLGEKDFSLIKNHLKLVTGLGFDFHWYQFANKTTLNPDTSYTWGTVDAGSGSSYKKNSLRTIHLQMPLLLEFNTSSNPRKTVHIAFGVIGQYMIGSRVKQEIEQNKYELTSIRKDAFNQSPFSAKAHVNLGYGKFTIFGEYSLTPLFQSGRGPELYPFAAGIRILPFS